MVVEAYLTEEVHHD